MAEFVNLTVASRLIGIDLGPLYKRAVAGHFGPTHTVGRETFVSTRGLELACRRSITEDQITAAKNGEPLPPATWSRIDDRRFHPRFSIEEIGADVVRTYHTPIEGLSHV